MPSICSIEPEHLEWLKLYVSPSVVTLLRFDKKTNNQVEFGIGFVIHVSNKKAVVIANTAVINEDDEYIKVRYGNGVVKPASVFVSNVYSLYTSFLVRDDEQYADAIRINTSDLGRGQVIFTIAVVWEALKKAGIYSGSIILPRCSSVKRVSKTPVNDHKDFVAFSCPVGEPASASQALSPFQGLIDMPAPFMTLIGAPVFNLKGQVVGVTEKCSAKSYDQKYARRSSSFLKEMQILFGGSDWEKRMQHRLYKKKRNKTS